MDTTGVFVVERAAGGYVPPTLRVGRNEVAPVRPTVHRGHVKPLWHLSDQVATSNSMASGIGSEEDDFARGVLGHRKEKPVAKEKSEDIKKTMDEMLLEEHLEKQRLEEEEEERKAHLLIDRPTGEFIRKRGSTPPKSRVALFGAGVWEPGQCVAESYPRAVSPDRMPVMPGPRIAVLGLTAKQIGQPASPTQPRRAAKDRPHQTKRVAQIPGGDLTQLARIPKK